MKREVDPENQEQSAFPLSLGVFFVLFSGVVCLALFYDFSDMNLGGLLFLIASLCCIFIAKNIYDLTSKSKVASRVILPVPTSDTQSLYTQLYNKSPVPYFVVDIEGIVISANTAAARLLGMQQSKVVGIDLFVRLEADEVVDTDFLFRKFRSGVAISDEMVRVKREDRREAWGLLSLFQFKNDYEEQQGLLTLVDITKQKKAEDAKSEFVSLASHQLRTPIAGMKWSAELLQLDSPDTLTERQLKYMNRLHLSISRMSRLVDDFLRVSRFELGRFQPEYHTIVLKKLFNDVLAELSKTAEHKNLDVQTDFDASVTEFVTDPDLLRMIVTNLCTNAIKYTPVGGTVTIRFTHDNNMLRIQVVDTGIGIPAEDQEGIFSKLFRASNAMRDVPDGTGLGLYIVREAVAVLRGKASFTSVEGVGTTFDVQIPFEVPSKD
jgi:PAS domain S-box-containing protein